MLGRTKGRQEAGTETKQTRDRQEATAGLETRKVRTEAIERENGRGEAKGKREGKREGKIDDKREGKPRLHRRRGKK
jgi:hypothetical protein